MPRTKPPRQPLLKAKPTRLPAPEAQLMADRWRADRDQNPASVHILHLSALKNPGPDRAYNLNRLVKALNAL